MAFATGQCGHLTVLEEEEAQRKSATRASARRSARPSGTARRCGRDLEAVGIAGSTGGGRRRSGNGRREGCCRKEVDASAMAAAWERELLLCF